MSPLLPRPFRRRLVKLAQRRVRRYGYSLVTAPPRGAGAPVWDVWDWIRASTRIRTVIDIGANDGSYASYLNEFFSPEVIHAFEPLVEGQAQLTALSRDMPNLRVHHQALSDEAGTATFFRNGYGPASSLLRVSEHSRRAFPETGNESPEHIVTARLDDVLPANSLKRDILIKIDVQGAEDRVIRGGTAVFSAAAIVMIELSFVPIYDGQPLFEEVHALLQACGLRLAGFKNQIDEPQTGQPLFAHCLYHRPAASSPP
jgi:FkbM family methyltransferase